MTSRVIVGRIDFHDFGMLDAMIASALKSFSTRRYISEKEQVSKSNVLKNTTDSEEEDKLRASISIPVQPGAHGSSIRTRRLVHHKFTE